MQRCFSGTVRGFGIGKREASKPGSRIVEAYVSTDQDFERVVLGLSTMRLKISTLDSKILEVLETL